MAGTPAPLLTADDESHGGGPLGTRTVPTHGSDFSQTLSLESASRTQQSLPGPQTRERETNARRSTLLSVRHFDERLRADPTREPERVSMHGSLGSFYKRDMKTGITCPKPHHWATTRTSALKVTLSSALWVTFQAFGYFSVPLSQGSQISTGIPIALSLTALY